MSSSDETHLRQVIFNLIGNSIKFTSDGNITLSAKLNRIQNQHADLLISVKDSGIGIEAEDIPKVMRPFEQADERYFVTENLAEIYWVYRFLKNYLLS
jgi:signal transduction histidine kinase